MEDKPDEVENIESSSGDSFIDDSDDDEPSTSGPEDKLDLKDHLTDKEIEEIISEFLENESKAAEAQEALEEESLARVEKEVREELAQKFHDEDLEVAVKEEMAGYCELWENTLDELETESSHLLEQLDGAGIELPSLYRWIESQAPNGCCTEAWKQRAHWIGTQPTCESSKSVTEAEEYLQVQRPVRRKHGKLLEEGASGFLQKKLAADGTQNVTENSEINWSSVSSMFRNDSSGDCSLFGSQTWASVYLASTPQQAAEMGLKFPGVDEVEEIEDVDGSSSDPFVADAIANEKELVLSEAQRKKFKKVKEEDDANLDRKLQLRLKRRRHRKRSKQQGVLQNEFSSVDQEIENNLDEPSADYKCHLNKTTCENGEGVPGNEEVEKRSLKNDLLDNSGAFDDVDKERSMSNGSTSTSESGLLDSTESRGCKRKNDNEEPVHDGKRNRSIITDCDGEVDVLEDKSVSAKLEDSFVLHENINSEAGYSNPSQSMKEKFYCTACHKLAIEVHSHPRLKVIVCKDCKCLLQAKMHPKDVDCSECYCGWCGQSSDLVSCKSCKTLFCSTCVKRNLGEAYLSEAQASCWQCCYCSPSLLQRLTLEFERALGSEAVIVSSSDSDSENSDEDNLTIGGNRKRKKKIRRILDDAELGEETKRKIAIEKERQERLKSLQVQFSSKSQTMSFANCDGGMPTGATVDVLGDAISGYIVNVVRDKGEEAVRIAPSISAKLKTHQVVGIRFMWENIIQSIRKVKSGDRGLGCILAHTMGLGKTFQVIAFLYTAMRSIDLGLRTALIVTPVNVLHNWRQEFLKWKPSEMKPLRVYMLEDVSRERRADLLAKWRAKGGVFLIGYTAFRNLSFGKHIKDRHMAREISQALQEGPDILVCDEAHMIKNTRADTTKALKQVKCQRRIALTGSPLQNNLMEYYCMVDFVREGFLGSSHEFRNRFQNPIENGQHTNSTSEDVKIMNQRSHILYEQLKGFVQRMDMNVVKKDLPPKTVFVVTVKLSPLQRILYKRFLDVHVSLIRKSFFAGYQALAQIWNHPGILQLTKEDRGRPNREEAEESSSDENIDYNMVAGEKPRTVNDFLQGKNDDGFLQKDWWNDLLQEHTFKEIDYGGKMVLLIEILTMCSDMGDKALVFSQSIPTLDLIEYYLAKLPRPGKKGKFWKKGKDWYRLDGRTESSIRQRLVERFNEPLNKRVKCTLISTRAGSLGINLHSANRVIIVDGSWNPTYDLQALYRAWRYGQTKPVFAYRLMANGTMEEKIYKRQVTKEGLAARVVDRQQVHRTISKEEMLHLFEFGDDENPQPLGDVSQVNGQGHNSTWKTGNLESCPSDKLMDRLLAKHHPRWIANYHEHETLLQENEEERLSKEEQDLAWEVFRKSLEWEEVQRVPIDESVSEIKTAAVTGTKSAAVPNVVPPKPKPELESINSTEPTGAYRSRVVLRKCTKLSHMLTLRSQGTKLGSTTVCGECAQVLRWEDLNRDSKVAS